MSEEMNVEKILENNGIADNDNFGMVSIDKLLEGMGTKGEKDNAGKEE